MWSIKQWCKRVHRTAVEKGWHKPRPKRLDAKQVGTWIALAHSELSEALEELRTAKDYDALKMRIESGKPEGFVVELADTVIRIMDTCEALGLDLEGAVMAKCAFNRSRPHRHGGKRV